MPLKLHLGCGSRRLDGYVNIDISKDVKPDVVADMCKLPYKTGIVDEIYSAHAIEHVKDLEGAIREMHRVLKKGGRAVIVAPYPAVMQTFVPQHERYFAWDSLSPFTKGGMHEYYYDFHFASQKIYLQAFKFGGGILAGFFNSHPYLYEHSFLCHLFPASEIRFELTK